MELSGQSVAEEIPGAGSSREIFMDEDLGQQDKVRALGKDGDTAERRTTDGWQLPLVLCVSRSAFLCYLQETTS